MQNLLDITASFVDSTISQSTSSVVASVPQKTTITILDIILKGGVLMIPLALLSIITIYIFLERYLAIRKHIKTDNSFIESVRDFIREGEINSALKLCRNTQKPIAHMIEKGILRIGKPVKEIEESIEIAGKFEVYNLEKNIGILSVIAGIAPMFGFLGSIIGVIKIFFEISLTTDISIGAVSAGLYTKMITSATGLVVGIMAYIAYHWLNSILNKAIHLLEWDTMNFIELLNEPAK